MEQLDIRSMRDELNELIGELTLDEHAEMDLEVLTSFLGAKLAVLRKRRGMTQGEVADLIGVKQPTISKRETGEQRGHLRGYIEHARALNAHLIVGIDDGECATFATMSPRRHELRMEWGQRPPPSVHLHARLDFYFHGTAGDGLRRALTGSHARAAGQRGVLPPPSSESSVWGEFATRARSSNPRFDEQALAYAHRLNSTPQRGSADE